MPRIETTHYHKMSTRLEELLVLLKDEGYVLSLTARKLKIYLCM
jgi:hypothetical protein